MFEMICISIGLTILTLSILILRKVFRNGHREQPRRKTIEPYIALSESFSIDKIEPYQQFAFKKGGQFHMTMGLRKLHLTNWLTVDKSYIQHHRIRADLLSNRGKQVLQCLPGSENACAETLDLVVEFLVHRYPQMFELFGGPEGQDSIRNKETLETFHIKAPYIGIAPLEIAARLAMDDFNVLLRHEIDGKHRLMASATLFPAGWFLQERIGWQVGMLHKPVPTWQEKVGAAVERYFARLDTINSMERSSFFVQATQPGQTLESILFHPEPFNTGDAGWLTANDILIRLERQTFRRLPRSGAVLFTVKTMLKPLTALESDEREAFLSEVKSWPGDIAAYKGRDFWGKVVSRQPEDQGLYLDSSTTVDQV